MNKMYTSMVMMSVLSATSCIQAMNSPQKKREESYLQRTCLASACCILSGVSCYFTGPRPDTVFCVLLNSAEINRQCYQDECDECVRVTDRCAATARMVAVTPPALHDNNSVSVRDTFKLMDIPSLASRPAVELSNHAQRKSNDDKQLFGLLRVDTDEKSEDESPEESNE